MSSPMFRAPCLRCGCNVYQFLSGFAYRMSHEGEHGRRGREKGSAKCKVQSARRKMQDARRKAQYARCKARYARGKRRPTTQSPGCSTYLPLQHPLRDGRHRGVVPALDALEQLGEPEVVVVDLGRPCERRGWVGVVPEGVRIGE